VETKQPDPTDLCPGRARGSQVVPDKASDLASPSRDMSEPLTLFTPSLPRELWREIFQLATFIHGELDIPSTLIRPDLFTIWDGRQQLAWKILPCRVAIQSVSRSWHSIGMDLLYRSFHDTEPATVRLFARTLRAQPSYGVLVRRLTLWYSNDIMSATVSIVQNCPNLLIHSTAVDQCAPEIGWHAYLHPTSLRLFDAIVDDIPLWDLFAALAQCPNLEILGLHEITEVEKPPPAPTRSIPFTSLRVLVLHRIDDGQPCAPIIERILSSLTLPCLTALSLFMADTSSPLSLRKDLLSRLTYLGLRAFPRGIVLDPLQATDLPRLRIFRLDTYITSLGELLSESPNFPIHQIDTLILSLPRLGGIQLTAWSSSLDGTLTEARNSELMPRLKCIILEEDFTVFTTLFKSEGDYEFITSYFSSLADVFESRGVELLVRNHGIWEGDTPIRDFFGGIVRISSAVCRP
jgi:hypothetical protein